MKRTNGKSTPKAFAISVGRALRREIGPQDCARPRHPHLYLAGWEGRRAEALMD